MSRHQRFLIFFAAVLILVSAFKPVAGQTDPEKFLGFKPGADRQLADYTQITAYFKKLAAESPRLKLFEIGTSTQKRPMIMAVITAAENMARLDSYRDITKKLHDPRTLSVEAAKKLAAEGKVLLLITCSIHASEIAASQMSLELAYKLASGQTPFDAERVLHDVIVLLVPSTNPDGNQLVCDWYRKYVGTPFEGGRLPWLYHVYAGHDNNRDWYMFNLPETRAVTRVLYHDWLPQIHIDEHQMGSTGPRLFVPPFMDPPVPSILPLLWRSVALCGTSMAYDLEQNGCSGVVHRRSYTAWWIGACDDTSWLHNTIGLLSEAASAKIATPVYVEPTEVEKSSSEKRVDFPNPWPGGWWRLRNIVDYELVMSLSLIKTAALHRQDFLFNFYRMNQTALETRESGDPYAFVIPAGQADPLTVQRLVEIAMFGGVEVQQAQADFVAGGMLYPAGSFVVPMAQPYKPYALALLDRQKYPDLRDNPNQPPIPPYDNAGWTLPLQMGVRCDRVEVPFKAKLENLSEPPRSSSALPGGDSPYLALDPRLNASYAVAIALLKEKIPLQRAGDPLPGDKPLPAGAFIVKNGPGLAQTLTPLLKKWPVPLIALKENPPLHTQPLSLPRIAIYQSWGGNMDEGWTRYVLDDFAIPYTVLHNKDFQDTKTKLRSRFDAIILPSGDAEMIKSGKPKPGSRFAQFFTPMPPEYEGGIEKQGVDGLKEFVAAGGTLVALNQACDFIFKEFQAPARNALEGLDSSKFFCPTSLLRIRIDNSSPVGYGMPEEAAAMFADSLAIGTWPPAGDWDRRVVASFPSDDLLLSGWLIGQDYLTRKAAVVDLTYKQGHIILMGIHVQHRGQTHGTYKFLFNSLLYPGKS